jgi:hypothetical protein
MTAVRGGLIQMALKAPTERTPAEIGKAMVHSCAPLIEKAGQAGVQVLCLQEVFNQPYFCPSQDPKWYAAAEPIPDGPTVKLMQDYAKTCARARRRPPAQGRDRSRSPRARSPPCACRNRNRRRRDTCTRP